MVFSAVALRRPALQVVFIADALDIGTQLVGTRKNARLIGTHNVRLSATGDFTLAISNNDDGGVPGLIHIDPVNARPRGIESQIRCINLKNFVPAQTSNTNSQRSFGEL